MFFLNNLTGFHAQNFLNVDQNNRAYHVIVAKVGYTFEIDSRTGQTDLTFSSIQPNLIFADEYHDAQNNFSSTMVESDFVLYKPKLDFIVNATAYAPMGGKTSFFPISLSIGNYQKSLAVYGERHWKREALGWALTQAEIIEQLPIRYEYAFGGVGTQLHYGKNQDEITEPISDRVSLHNPIGRGFYHENYLNDLSWQRFFPAHQIDNPLKPVMHPCELRLPQGFGCYSRYFASRLPLAGTTDMNWVNEHAPLLPTDFSMHYWNGAHPDLQFTHFKYNHLYDCVFTGLIPDTIAPKQTFYVQLPVESLFVQLYTANNLSICRDLILDTIWIDVETKRIDCTYRRAFAEEIEIETAELRYIARHERGAQIELFNEMQHSPVQTNYILLPPSLHSVPL